MEIWINQTLKTDLDAWYHSFFSKNFFKLLEIKEQNIVPLNQF